MCACTGSIRRPRKAASSQASRSRSCRRFAPGRSARAVAIAASSPTCQKIRRCGHESPRRWKTASVPIVRCSTIVSWSRRGARRRKPIWSWSITICCSRIWRSSRKASAKSCPVRTPLSSMRHTRFRNWPGSFFPPASLRGKLPNWRAMPWPSAARSRARSPACASRSRRLLRQHGARAWRWTSCRQRVRSR